MSVKSGRLNVGRASKIVVEHNDDEEDEVLVVVSKREFAQAIKTDFGIVSQWKVEKYFRGCKRMMNVGRLGAMVEDDQNFVGYCQNHFERRNGLEA